jgi:hypothetical protein
MNPKEKSKLEVSLCRVLVKILYSELSIVQQIRIRNKLEEILLDEIRLFSI